MARQLSHSILTFPKRGVNQHMPRFSQSIDTCINCMNVRLFDSLEDRERGGIRPGLTKVCSQQIDGTNRIQNIDSVTVVSNASPSQSSLSNRTIKPFAIANGTAATFNTTAVNTATVSGSRTLSNTAPFIQSAEIFQRLYMTDGISYKVWVASNNTLIDWTPTAGSLPGTDGTRVPRLIVLWNGRLVLSGLTTDPHNWWMSAAGEPLDFDTAPDPRIKTQAFSGSTGIVGEIGDVITCLIPFADDVLIFGCDHSIYALSGDPGDGATLDLVTDTVGIAFGSPWCRDGSGAVYFFSNRGDVYMIPGPGNPPACITKDNIGFELNQTDLNTTSVRMTWDEEKYGFNLWLTPYTAGNTFHWFYDVRKEGWFRDKFADVNMNPIAVSTFDGDDPDDRATYLGSEDGYIRMINTSASDDDGTDIESWTIIGPISSGESHQEIIVSELQAELDLNSSVMKYEVVTGDTPEAALNKFSNTFTATGTFSAGLSHASQPKKRGYYAFIKVGNTASATPWAFENVRVKLEVITSGNKRFRSYE